MTLAWYNKCNPHTETPSGLRASLGKNCGKVVAIVFETASETLLA